jgi:predicted transcriptional regulator
MGKGPYLFWGFRPPREALGARLGTLERQAIEVVWAGREVTVRDVHARLDGRVAYTTVMTTLDRLFRKGLLARTKRSRAFVYSARASREELDDIVANAVVSGLLAGEWSAPLPFLSNLVDAVGERDRALLQELERLVRIKQRELGGRQEAPKAGNGPTREEEP